MTALPPIVRPWSQVPPEAAARLRPALPAISDAISAALPRLVPEYARPMEGDVGRALREGVTVSLVQFVDLLGSDGDLPDLVVYERLGRAQLREGRTLDALRSAYRVGARTAWCHIAQLDVEPARRSCSPRRCSPPSTGWPARRWCGPGGPRPADAARTIAAALEAVGVLLVPDPDASDRQAQVAAGLGRCPAVLGPTVGWAQAPRSVVRATAACRLHAQGALGGAGLVRADDHLLALLLAADPGLARDLVRLRLQPLLDQPDDVRARGEATLRAWHDAQGDVSRTADALGVHPQTVRYRLAGLRELFGDALDHPGTRLEIALALRVPEQEP